MHATVAADPKHYRPSDVLVVDYYAVTIATLAGQRQCFWEVGLDIQWVFENFGGVLKIWGTLN
jgi:hypothetical protein